MQTFGREEAKIIDILHPRRIQELGIWSQGEAMEIGDRPLASIRPELLQKLQRYVLLTRDGQPEGRRGDWSRVDWAWGDQSG